MPPRSGQVPESHLSKIISNLRHRPETAIKVLLGAVGLALVLGCPSNRGDKGAPAPAPTAPTPIPALSPPPAATPTPLAAVVPAKPRPAPRAPVRKAVAPAPAANPAAASMPTSAPALPPVPPSSPVPPAPATAVALPPPAPRAEPKPAPLPASPRPAAASPTPMPVPTAGVRCPWTYGFQAALVIPSSGGLRTTAGRPSVALGLHATWSLPKGLRLRPRLDYTVFAGETRSSTAAPLPQTLDTRVSSLALGADLLVPLGTRWSLGLAVAGVRWSVASINTVTPTLGGSMTLAGTSRWTRLAVGPVLTFKVSEHLELEGRALSSHYGYQNQPANTAAVGLLWRF